MEVKQVEFFRDAVERGAGEWRERVGPFEVVLKFENEI